MPSWRLGSSRSALKRRATELYGHVVAWARAPWLYSDLGVPDTPEGRLELVLLHVTVLLDRLLREEDAELLGRALTETFVTDMDDCMREMGVSDIGVARKVKKAAAALYDRSRDYRAAMAAPGNSRLSYLIGEHIGAAGGQGRADRLAAYVRALAERLERADLAAIEAGGIVPPVAQEI